MQTTKPYTILTQVVLDAYKKVKANRGAAGVDEETIKEFEQNLKGNLYKIWNRMSSGSYFPPAVKRVEIPKDDGKTRKLGIPTVSDRVAQMVVKLYLEPVLEPIFHEDSYGYRPKKSAINAVGKARERCWRYDWVLDVDIKGFFDNIDHELMKKAVQKHTNCKWILLYIERWLKAPVQLEDGTMEARDKGTPQGGVISPLLANLYLHYAFDEWMKRKSPNTPFERYADDIVVHCKTELEAQHSKEILEKRLAECKLQLHPEKTKIVYCKDGKRRLDYPNTSFDFLGYTFRARLAKTRREDFFVNFSPGVSNKSKKRLMEKVREMKIQRKSGTDLNGLAETINPILRGWINYFDKYYKTATFSTLQRIDDILVNWAVNKYRSFRRNRQKARKWLRVIAEREPELFVHWQLGINRTAEQ
jgi:RNA-directed DNA polymerase